MKTKNKYSFNVGVNYNSKKDEWNISLGVNMDFEQEKDSNDLLESTKETSLLEDRTE